MKRLMLAGTLLSLLLANTVIAASTRPNIVFVVIDNVDFSHLGQCYGGTALTPTIDRIASRGITFKRAYATTPLCVPSRYACLTGRYASRCRSTIAGREAVVDNDDHAEAGGRCTLENDLPNLPRVMQQVGYATGLVGKYHLEDESYPRFDGEASVFDPEGDVWLKKRCAWLTRRIEQRGFDEVFNPIDFRVSQFRGIDFEQATHNMEAEVLGAMNFIDENRSRPFFLYLSTRLLHLPIDKKLLVRDYAKFGRVTEGGLLPEAPQVPMPSRAEMYDSAAAHGAQTSQEFGIHWLDCGLKTVIDRLEQLEILNSTLVIVFSDNNMRGKETLYEGGARVPLLSNRCRNNILVGWSTLSSGFEHVLGSVDHGRSNCILAEVDRAASARGAERRTDLPRSGRFACFVL